MDWGILLNIAVLLAIGVLILLVYKYVPSYLVEKGKNLATKEDIGGITREQEAVKEEFARRLRALEHDYQKLLARLDQHHQLSLAALPERLRSHQEAYVLWWKLMGKTHKKDEIGEIVIECQDWWVNHCLYLSEKPRHAFRAAYHAASMHRELVEACNDPDGVKENWEILREAGEIIVNAVALPSWGQDEYKPLELSGGDS